MTDGLTARQTQILKAIIDEYIVSTEAVGSESLDKKYSLGISPATIRNEMVALTKAGYLKQLHTSAGRVPTPMAMKFYINQLMEEKQLSLADEVKAKEEVWDARGDLESLLAEATKSLAQKTQSLALAATDEGKVWRAGYANVFINPEFADLDVCSGLFSFLEEAERIRQLFFTLANPESSIDVFFGDEIGWPGLASIGVVATHFTAKGKNGALGVVGPFRLSYATIIPTLKYFSNMIEEVAGK